ncbi:hypothetical protein Pfo_002572 [Paulownia fortunei]|nr:hypothetical protein Pfo_002572 [Paulownia fortunei]
MAILTGIKNAKMLLAKPISLQGWTVGRCMSKFVGSNDPKKNTKGASAEDEQLLADPRRCWVPHPRSGIYFPEGHEKVMEGIPNHAASFDPTFWLRNTNGVDDKPDPDN